MNLYRSYFFGLLFFIATPLTCFAGVGWSLVLPAGTLDNGVSNTNAFGSTGIVPISEITRQTGVASLVSYYSAVFDASNLPPYVDTICLVPLVDQMTKVNLYLNVTYGMASIDPVASFLCKTRTNSPDFINFGVSTTPGSHQIGFALYASSKSEDLGWPRIFDGIVSLVQNPASGRNLLFQKNFGTTYNFTDQNGLPEVRISAPEYIVKGDKVDINYNTIPQNGSGSSDSCIAMSNPLLPEWNGSMSTANVSTVTITVNSLSVDTTFSITCSNVFGSHTAILKVTPVEPEVSFTSTRSIVSSGGNTTLGYGFLNEPSMGLISSCQASANPTIAMWQGVFPSPNNSVSNVGPITANTDFFIQCSSDRHNGMPPLVTSNHKVTVQVVPNRPPDAPIVTGPSTGSVGVGVTFTMSSTDPDYDNVAYALRQIGVGSWMWSNPLLSSWVQKINPSVGDFGPQGIQSTFTRSFASNGLKTLEFKAQDTKGAESLITEKMIVIGSQPSSGVCGDAIDTPSIYYPTNNLCQLTGVAPNVTGNQITDKWSWVCSGVNGGSNTSCSAELLGSCGSAQALPPSANAPSVNLCISGNPSAVVASGNQWQWSCAGTGGNNSTCFADKLAAQNGVCGVANNKKYATAPPVPHRCLAGYDVGFITTGTGWRWKCSGLDGGVDSGFCNATKLKTDFIETN